jgi:Flp pilus assembly pilin Flp
MLASYIHVHTALVALACVAQTQWLASGVAGSRRRLGDTDERGQTTAEYALVLLGAAAVALLVVAWATDTDLIGKLFDAVVEAVTGKVQ